MRIDLPTEVFAYPDIALPEVWTVEQEFDTPALTPEEIEANARQSVEELLREKPLAAGASVAIGVGSRGLDNLPLIVRTVVGALREKGLAPFIIPAMGSHGGATAEGQKAVLEGYGITLENVGAEIRATMETVEVGKLEGEDAGEFAGHPVVCDRYAYAADAILLISRIKAHTDFTGPLESGVGKMCAIGLGKRQGAAGIHLYGAYGLRELIPRVARFLAQRLPLLGGIALLENELGHTAEIHALTPPQIAREDESALLARARKMAPRLPFPEIDALLIDEMGKNISGTGMDTHVIGRALMPSFPESEWDGPRIRLIAVFDLTAETQGNATGLGLADLTTSRLIAKADWNATFANIRTSGEGGILKARLPLVLPTADDCARAALGACGQYPPSKARLVRIHNTLHTQCLEISGALLESARRNPRLRVSETSHPLDLCHPIRPLAPEPPTTPNAF